MDFDERMRSRVIAFQKHHGIADSGVACPLTWAKLMHTPGVDPSDVPDPYKPYAPAPGPIIVDPGREVVVSGSRYTIFPDEVRKDGSVTWRGRNPGAIGIGEKYGAYPGKKASAHNSEGLLVSVAVFPDEDIGFEAIKTLVKDQGTKTLLELMKGYAPAVHGSNDPVGYARDLAKALGVRPETKIDDLGEKVEALAEEIKKREGWKQGTPLSLTDPSLPPQVKAAINK